MHRSPFSEQAGAARQATVPESGEGRTPAAPASAKSPLSPPSTPEPRKAVLHICRREVLRPLRDQILRLSGFEVESTCEDEEALRLYSARLFDLVLIDVDDDSGIPFAEHLCATVKSARTGQCVAFVCNWRTRSFNACPDAVLRTEFNPAAFREGVCNLLADRPPVRA